MSASVVFRARSLTFEWDPEKAASNRAKHGVSFEEAATVFLDPLARLHDDPDSRDDEDRFLLIGMSTASRVLLVVHAAREDHLRIISARRATRREKTTLEAKE